MRLTFFVFFVASCEAIFSHEATKDTNGNPPPERGGGRRSLTEAVHSARQTKDSLASTGPSTSLRAVPLPVPGRN